MIVNVIYQVDGQVDGEEIYSTNHFHWSSAVHSPLPVSPWSHEEQIHSWTTRIMIKALNWSPTV